MYAYMGVLTLTVLFSPLFIEDIIHLAGPLMLPFIWWRELEYK